MLSKTTANALKSQDRYYTKSTIKFIEMFDRVFDCLNVSQFNIGDIKEKGDKTKQEEKKRYRKKDKDVYTDWQDERFTVQLNSCN